MMKLRHCHPMYI